MEFESQPSSKITFLNEPKLSEHEVDKKFNDRRLELIPHIRDFISHHERFKGKEVKVTFAHKGASSLVSIIEIPEGRTVLKLRLSITHSFAEAHFLKVWEAAGVKVPHVIEDGAINGHAYILMEFIDAPILSTAYRKGETVRKEIYVELGKILRKMHIPEAEGYGRVIEGNPEFKNFKDWLVGEDVQKHIRYVKENKLLGEEHGSLDVAIQILIDFVGRENKSSYCHDDFGTANMFATEPLTVFDPNPRFNNGYIDLARSMIMNIAGNENTKGAEQLVQGYFGDESFNRRALQAALLLNAYLKFDYMHKTKYFDRMKNIQEYLMKSKHMLEC